jgi:hypothetical protein
VDRIDARAIYTVAATHIGSGAEATESAAVEDERGQPGEEHRPGRAVVRVDTPSPRATSSTCAAVPGAVRPCGRACVRQDLRGNPNEGATEVEVCATVAAAGERTIAAHGEAYVRVTKSQVTGGQLGEVYEAIEKWITVNGLAVGHAPREVYWTDFMAAAPDDEVFDVAFPVT